MKYKRLQKEELKELEKEFIHFLSSAQVTGPDWEKMKKEEPGKAEELLDVFSDMVYEKVTSKIEYLEFREERNLKVFWFGQEKVELVGMELKPGSKLDLRSEDVFRKWNAEEQAGVTLLFSEKDYTDDRGTEIFRMLESGCLITDGRLFKLIKSFA